MSGCGHPPRDEPTWEQQLQLVVFHNPAFESILAGYIQAARDVLSSPSRQVPYSETED